MNWNSVVLDVKTVRATLLHFPQNLPFHPFLSLPSTGIFSSSFVIQDYLLVTILRFSNDNHTWRSVHSMTEIVLWLVLFQKRKIIIYLSLTHWFITAAQFFQTVIFRHCLYHRKTKMGLSVFNKRALYNPFLAKFIK